MHMNDVERALAHYLHEHVHSGEVTFTAHRQLNYVEIFLSGARCKRTAGLTHERGLVPSFFQSAREIEGLLLAATPRSFSVYV
jgi:hypothetical protein